MDQSPGMDRTLYGKFEVLQSCCGTHITVVGRGGQLLVFLSSEDINGNEMTLGVAVLASLGGGNIGNLRIQRDGAQAPCPAPAAARLIAHLARLAVDAHVSALANGASLLRVGERRACDNEVGVEPALLRRAWGRCMPPCSCLGGAACKIVRGISPALTWSNVSFSWSLMVTGRRRGKGCALDRPRSAASHHSHLHSKQCDAHAPQRCGSWAWQSGEAGLRLAGSC